MNRLKYASLSLIALFFYIPIAHATSGACSSHQGVNCSTFDLNDLSVICNDGWPDSSVSILNSCDLTLDQQLTDIALSYCRNLLSGDQATFSDCVQNNYFVTALKFDPTCKKGMRIADNDVCQCLNAEIWNGSTCEDYSGPQIQQLIENENIKYCGVPVDDTREEILALGVLNTHSFDYLYQNISLNCNVDPEAYPRLSNTLANGINNPKPNKCYFKRGNI